MRILSIMAFGAALLVASHGYAGGMPVEKAPEPVKAETNAPLPESVLNSLEKAHASGDAFILQAVKEKATSDFPESRDVIANWQPKPEQPVAQAKADAPKNVIPHPKSPQPTQTAGVPTPVYKPWWKPEDGEVEAAANFSFGNSEKKDYFIKTTADHKWGSFENTVTLQMQSSEEEGVRTEEEYQITNQTRQTVDDRNYNFLEIELEKDRFSGIQSRVSEFIGRGHTFTKRDDMEWKGEAAGGFTHTKFTDGTEDNSPSARLTSRFNWDINDSWTYKNLTKSTITQEQLFTEFNNSIETKLTDVLKLRAAVDIDHDTEVPANTKETDVETRIGVVYDF